MALPSIMRKLFRNDGYGPLLKPEIIPFASDLASDDGSVAASTGWVKDLAAASVYVDAGVSSSGDGFSAAAAKKTIGEAVALCKSLNQAHCKIFVAGGTYNESVSVHTLTCDFVLLGNVTITGSFTAQYSIILVYGDTHQLTVQSGVFSYNLSYVVFSNLSLLEATASGNPAFEVAGKSSVICYSTPCYFFTQNTHSVLYMYDSSYVKFYNNSAVTIRGRSISSSGLSCSDSYLFAGQAFTVGASNTDLDSYANGITFSRSSADFSGKLSVYNVTTGNGLAVTNNSICLLRAGCELTSGTGTAAAALQATYSSVVHLLGGSSTRYLLRAAGSAASGLGAVGTSSIFVSGELFIVAPSTGGYRAIRSDECSYILLTGGNITHTIWDAWDLVIGVIRNSCLYIDTGTAFANHATGRKFSVSQGGQIITNTIAPTNMPGNGSYTIDANSFGYYK